MRDVPKVLACCVALVLMADGETFCQGAPDLFLYLKQVVRTHVEFLCATSHHLNYALEVTHRIEGILNVSSVDFVQLFERVKHAYRHAAPDQQEQLMLLLYHADLVMRADKMCLSQEKAEAISEVNEVIRNTTMLGHVTLLDDAIISETHAERPTPLRIRVLEAEEKVFKAIMGFLEKIHPLIELPGGEDCSKASHAVIVAGDDIGDVAQQLSSFNESEQASVKNLSSDTVAGSMLHFGSGVQSVTTHETTAFLKAAFLKASEICEVFQAFVEACKAAMKAILSDQETAIDQA